MNYPPQYVLDLCCKAGGSAVGLSLVWPNAKIYGIDHEPQPRYPFIFYCADVLEWAAMDWRDFDFIWASPPCQAHSDLQKRSGIIYRCLIPDIRRKLEESGRPYVIENVDRAPLVNPRLLCGSMFGLGVIRHRIFESNWDWQPPEHPAHNGSTGTHRWPYKPNGYVQVTGGGNCTVKQASEAMGIDWMIKRELNEAIPPAYSRYIAEQWLTNGGMMDGLGRCVTE